jgi:putative transposase
VPIPAGAADAPTPSSASRAGTCTARRSSGCGARRPAGASRRRKRQRIGTSTCPADRLAAEHPNHVWALDYQFDQTLDGRILKLRNVVDEHTREALTIAVDRRIHAEATVNALDHLVTERRTAPKFIRCDNGPDLTAHALRDWCRFNQARTSYIEPGSPRQSPSVESFGGRLRDELLAVEAFSSCSRPGCWSRTGGSSTTPSGLTAPSAI